MIKGDKNINKLVPVERGDLIHLTPIVSSKIKDDDEPENVKNINTSNKFCSDTKRVFT